VLPPAVRAEFRLAHLLATDTNDVGILHELLRQLTERLGRRLRRRDLAARRLTVTVDYADYRQAARGVLLREATLDVELRDAARRALALAMSRRIAVRRVEVVVDRLVVADRQLELWGDPNRTAEAARTIWAPPRGRALQAAIDRIWRAGPPSPLALQAAGR
jgi:hypothetical protein